MPLTSTIELLKELRRKLHSQHMSALIGAGFSKNVDSELFPSWSQLIYDMAYFLEGKTIETNFSLLPASLQSDRDDYVKNEINRFIEKTGYLELVSLYQKRKGFQESVAHYIEERTPYIKTNDDGKRLLFRRIDKGKNDVELTDEKLALHQLLINLSWNNIYTTNYDRLLEAANDDTNRITLLELLKNVENNLSQLYKDYNSQKSLLFISELEFATHKAIFNNSFIANDDNLFLSNNFFVPYDDTTGLELQRNINEIKNKLIFIESQIKINEKEKIDIQKEIDNCLITVVKSSQLGIKRNKNIIKLHGDLRETTDFFGFDNDIRNHYIISKEDYDLYPKQHEAFTQLMRISLLQESYCLIGFSGEDPNFLGWISWVRDVIEKGSENADEIKLFLVDVGSPKDETDRALLFSNHRIRKIYLDDKKVITFLEKETGLKLDSTIDTRKALLQLFLNYLSIDDFETPKIFLEKHYKKQFLDAWGKISINYDSKKLPTNFEKNIDLIIENRKHLTLIDLNYSGLHYLKSFVYKFFIYTTLVKNKQNLSKKIIEASFIAFDILQLYPQQIWENEQLDVFEKLLSNNDEKNQYQILKQKHGVLSGEKFKEIKSIETASTLNDEMKSNKILACFFDFDFESAKKEIEKWQPKTGLFILRKVGYLSYFSPKNALIYLDSKKGVIEKSSFELLTYYFQYSILLDGNSFNESIKKKRELYNKLEKKGFIGITTHFKELSEQFKVKSEKITPYGDGRFSLSNNFEFSNDITDSGKSFQYLHLCIHFGLPLQLPSYSVQNSETWYKILKINFENYPLPYLFYSLNYTDEKVIRRIGQDYAYSETTLPFVKDNLIALLKTYLNKETPLRFKKSILLLTSEWLITVESKKWELTFISIINEPAFFEKALDERRQESFLFLKKALPLLKDEKIILKIIEICLKQYVKKNTAVELLYYLFKDKSSTARKIKPTTKIKELIEEKISLLTNEPTLWFILGNLKEILSKKELKAIESIYQTIDFDKIENARIWKVMYFFIKHDPKLLEIFKKGLLKSKTIFKSGFTLDDTAKIKSFSSGEHFASIRYLNNEVSIWTQEELNVLFERLKDELNLINEWNKKDRYTKFDFIYEEMIDFLVIEKLRLDKIEDYDSIYDFVNTELIKARGYETIKVGLLSKDKNIVLKALAELSLKMYDDKFLSEDIHSLSLLLNRLLFEDDFFTEVVLNYLAVWLKEEKIKVHFSVFEDLLLLILEKFKDDIPTHFNKPFVLSQLINIADYYEKVYCSNKTTLFYKELLKINDYQFSIH